MVAKCFYCKATQVEISHIKECATKSKATVATAVPALVAVTAPAPAVKAVPAHREAMAALKAKNAADTAKVQIGTIVVDATTDANGYLIVDSLSAVQEKFKESVLASTTPATKVAPQDMELGFYFKDGNAYKIVFNKAGTQKYAMKLAIQPTWGKNGKTLTGKWYYSLGSIYDLQPEHKMTKEVADNYAAHTLEKYGVAFCCVCGRKLTAKESVAKSMGPVCSGKL